MSESGTETPAAAKPQEPPRIFLVVVDETEEMRNALRFACRRAQHSQGRVALLYVIEPVEFQHWLGVGRVMEEEARAVGLDDRDVRYHTARAGFSYELAGGVAFVADGQMTRSAVYNAGRLSFGLRFRQVSVPEP